MKCSLNTDKSVSKINKSFIFSLTVQSPAKGGGNAAETRGTNQDVVRSKSSIVREATTGSEVSNMLRNRCALMSNLLGESDAEVEM